MIHHALPYAARLEAELAVDPHFRQAFIHVFPMAQDEALEDHLVSLREGTEREFGAD